MTAVITKLRLYVSVGDSPVMNEIGSVDVASTAVPLPTNAALDAKFAIDVDIPSALRQMAAELERGQ